MKEWKGSDEKVWKETILKGDDREGKRDMKKAIVDIEREKMLLRKDVLREREGTCRNAN